MRLATCLALLLAACNTGNVKIGEGDTDVYDANDHKENVAPGAPDVAVKPSRPDTTEDLVATIVFDATDGDGDHLTYRYVWLEDGEERTDLTTPTVPASETRRGDRWEVRVRAYDGREFGPTASDKTEIDNAKPTLSLKWKVSSPSTDDDLVVKVAADDPDNDDITLSFVWTADGETMPFATNTVPAASTSGGEAWKVHVEAEDEEGDVAKADLSVTISNRAPVITELTVLPNPAPVSADLYITGTVSDPDGDEVVATYAWKVNGATTPYVTAGVPRAATHDGELWEVTVFADDQHGGTSQASASTQVINHAPTVTPVRITPDPPGDGDVLRLQGGVATDADGDLLTVTYSWYRNGSLYVGLNGTSVANTYTTGGDTWQVSVSATDGSATTGPVLSQVVTIVDRPPSVPTIGLNPTTPSTCGPLVCKVYTDSVDPDGTAVAQTVSWTRNGLAYSGTRNQTYRPLDTIPVAALTPGDQWTCRITAASNGKSVYAEASGTVVGSGPTTESFTATARAAVDILLMVDDSCSMTDYQTNLNTALPNLVTSLNANSVDYHIGVVTSDMDSPSKSGRMPRTTGNVPYVTSTTVNRDAELAALVNAGTGGSADERGLDSTYAALTTYASTDNAGFLRANTPLSILFLSDEDDYSNTVTPTDYVNWMLGLRPVRDLTVWGIIASPAVALCALGNTGDGYLQVINALGGSRTSICDASYVDPINQFALAASGRSKRLTLSLAASPSGISVVRFPVGGGQTTLTPTTDYTFDSASNTIVLSVYPTSGTRHEVTFNPACQP